MNYFSTRNSRIDKTFDQIIIEGLSADGGLFMPKSWPKINLNNLIDNKDLTYADLASTILINFVGETISKSELDIVLKESFKNFSHKEVAPLVEISKGKYILELFHGPTYAFKDYPLQIVGNLFQYFLAKNNKKITVIGATSGDTGSAAIEACKDKENIKVFILHPFKKTSEIQRKQMTTVESNNVHNIAINGTFDDCQKIVKDLFVSEDINKITSLSAINSINWARIISQTVYFYWAFLQSKDFNSKINFIVPTGNFGNVYAAHVAGITGLPIRKLYVSTNENDIMHRTLKYGDMSLKKVKSTISPSMDIQISSNFERQLFESLNCDSDKLKDLMTEFYKNKKYIIKNKLLKNLKDIYESESFKDEEIIKTIQYFYEKYNYISDPHTATSLNILKKIDNKDINVSLACAHPAKFPDSILKAINVDVKRPEKLNKILNMKEKYIKLDNNIESVKSFIIENL